LRSTLSHCKATFPDLPEIRDETQKKSLLISFGLCRDIPDIWAHLPHHIPDIPKLQDHCISESRLSQPDMKYSYEHICTSWTSSQCILITLPHTLPIKQCRDETRGAHQHLVTLPTLRWLADALLGLGPIIRVCTAQFVPIRLHDLGDKRDN